MVGIRIKIQFTKNNCNLYSNNNNITEASFSPLRALDNLKVCFGTTDHARNIQFSTQLVVADELVATLDFWVDYNLYLPVQTVHRVTIACFRDSNDISITKGPPRV